MKRRASSKRSIPCSTARARAKPGATPPCCASLGHRAAALDRTAEARAWYELAIEADPTDSESQQALYRLNLRHQAGPQSPSSEPGSQQPAPAER